MKKETNWLLGYLVLTVLAIFGLDVMVVGDKFHPQSFWIGGVCLMVAILAGVLLPVITNMMLSGEQSGMNTYIHVMNVMWDGCLKGLVWGGSMSILFGFSMSCLFGLPYVIDSSTKGLGSIMGPYSEVVIKMGWLSIPFGILFILIRIPVKKLWRPPTQIVRRY